MSRSFKHHPINKDGDKRKKPFKQLANRRVRRKLKNNNFEVDLKGKSHRKLTETWEIADYVCRWSKEDAIKEYEKHIKQKDTVCENPWDKRFFEEYPTLESYLHYWEKKMKRK